MSGAFASLICFPGDSQKTLRAITKQAAALYADLKKFLKKNADGNTLGVADSKLGSIIREKLGIPCIYR